jgi:hypothetical protein
LVIKFCIDPILLCVLIPIKSYSNAENDKEQILKDNSGQSGIPKFGLRAFSTNPSIILPEKVYKNPDKEKSQIFSENKGLTGIYC